jgi:hypothetical protein
VFLEVVKVPCALGGYAPYINMFYCFCGVGVDKRKV